MVKSVTLNQDYIRQFTALASQDKVHAGELNELLFNFRENNTELSIWNSSASSLTNAEVKAKQEEINIQIEEYEDKKEEEYIKLVEQQEELATELENMNNAIHSIAQMSDELEQTQKDRIATASEEVMHEYIMGRIPREEVEEAIAERLDDHSRLDSLRIKNALLECEDFQTSIAAIDAKIADIGTAIENYDKEIANLQTLATIYTAMSKVDPLSAQSTKRTYSNGAPIYTAAKRDLIEKIRAEHGTDTPAQTTGFDIYGSKNKNTEALFVALGSGDVDKSILKEMADAGFTYKEAAYAITWLYGSHTGISFNPKTNEMTIPNGHGTEARKWYSTLKSQLNTLFAGGNAVNPNDTETGNPIGGSTGGTEVTGGGGTEDTDTDLPEDTDPGDGNGGGGDDVNQNTTDPIGFNNGNTSYSFVTDANNDGIFNSSAEFVGARELKLDEIKTEDLNDYFNSTLLTHLNITDTSQLKKFDIDNDGKITGMEELFMFDTDGNGKIENTELDWLTVVENVETKGKFAFMTAAMAGVSEIDLTKFQTNSEYAKENIKTQGSIDINGNMTLNNFDVTLKNGNKFNGYQRLDRNDYLTNMFAGINSAHYTNDFKYVKNADGTGSAELVNKTEKEVKWGLFTGTAEAKKLLNEAIEKETINQTNRETQAKILIEQKGATILTYKPETDEENDEEKNPDKVKEQPYQNAKLFQDVSHLETPAEAPDPRTNPEEYCTWMNEYQEEYTYKVDAHGFIVKTKN